MIENFKLPKTFIIWELLLRWEESILKCTQVFVGILEKIKKNQRETPGPHFKSFVPSYPWVIFKCAKTFLTIWKSLFWWKESILTCIQVFKIVLENIGKPNWGQQDLISNSWVPHLIRVKILKCAKHFLSLENNCLDEKTAFWCVYKIFEFEKKIKWPMEGPQGLLSNLLVLL